MDINTKKKVLKKRIQNYNRIGKILKTIDSDEKCGLKSFSYKKIGSSSRYGIVYRLSFLKNLKLPSIVVKVMDKTRTSNIYESTYYEMFKEKVLKKKTPHFPLTWEGTICDNKCNFIDIDNIGNKDETMREKWKSIKKDKCFLIFSELFSGDLSKYASVIKDYPLHYKISLTCSMIFQVMMGFYTLQLYGLAHNDLHTDNVLYYSICKEGKEDMEKKNKKYLKYKVGKKTYYLEIYQHMFVLWDFGKISRYGKSAPYSAKKLEERKFPPFKPLSSIYWDMAVFIDALQYFIFKANIRSKNMNSFISLLRSNYIACAIEYSKNPTQNKLPNWNGLMEKMIETSIEAFHDSVVSIGENKEKNKNVLERFSL